MKQRFKSAMIAVLAAAFVWWALPGFGVESQARIVRLSYVQGQAQIDRNAGQGFEKAIVNMPITQGTRLETGADGRAEAQFENGTTLRLAPNSEVVFEQLGLSSSGAKISHVVVNNGTAYFNVRHKGKDQFSVAFDNRDLVLKHDAEFRVDTTKSDITLAVFKGNVKLQGAGQDITVKKGDTLTVDRSNGQSSLAKNIQPSQYDEWSKERDQYEQEYSMSSYSSGYPYYGRGDLNYYGNYWYMPGYGYLWQPYGVGYGWSPFTNGAWCWYPGLGYTWVSSYPWGWLPYRYGSWRFVPGWGWGWMPTSYWNTWTPVPVVVNPPGNFVPPKPPRNIPRNETVVVTNPPPPPGNTWRGGTAGGVSTVPPTPLPPKPRVSITPIGPAAGTVTRNGIVTATTPAPSVPSGQPATRGPVTPVPPVRTPATVTPAAPVERSVPRSVPPPAVTRPSGPPPSVNRPSVPPQNFGRPMGAPQSFSRPSAVPQSFSRPSAAPQSFSRPSAAPQSFSRPMGAGNVMSNPGAHAIAPRAGGGWHATGGAPQGYVGRSGR